MRSLFLQTIKVYIICMTVTSARGFSFAKFVRRLKVQSWQIKIALINDCLRASKVLLKFSIPTNYNFAVI